MPGIRSRLIVTNFTKGRSSRFPIDTIVIHVMEGSMAGTLSWFNNPRAEASAHYGISREGEIVQYVQESDTAWHAGRVDRPTAPIILERAGNNPNGFSIGIEHEGTGRNDLTPAQRAASEWLIRDIAIRRRIPLTRRHIIGHREIFSQKTCPGRIDVDALVRGIAPSTVRPAREKEDYPRAVWSEMHQSYLVVTRYVDDNNWHFLPIKDLPIGIKAGTPLSQMPNDNPR